MFLIQKVFNRIIIELKIFAKIYFAKNLWLSLGENCLSDRILQRHGLKSFSTPYSNGRSNIDYALMLEKIDYMGYLDRKNLAYGYAEDEKVVRSSLINQCDKIYFTPHMKNFEFTHHDVIQSQKARKNLKRKTRRMRMIKGKSNVVFLYHYRTNENSNLNLLFSKAIDFINLYTSKKSTCNMIIFTQKIINHTSLRKVRYENISGNILFFEIYTKEIWTGPNQDTFWANMDDDLITIMLNNSIAIINSKKKIDNGIVN